MSGNGRSMAAGRGRRHAGADKGGRRVPVERLVVDRATFAGAPAEIGLSAANFFYGKNGVGKSTIARSMRAGASLSWGEGFGADGTEVLVYDRDFVAENVAAAAHLPGVFTIAAENIQVQARLAAGRAELAGLEAARDAAVEKRDAVRRARDKARDDFANRLWERTYELRKRFGKAISFNKQSKKKFADGVLAEKPGAQLDLSAFASSYEAAFDAEAGEYPLFRMAGDRSSYASLAGYALLSQPLVNSGDTPFAQFMEALGSLDWVRAGHTRFHAGARGRCPYCQQELPAGFEQDLAACFDERYNEGVRALEELEATYARELDDVVEVLEGNARGRVLPSLDLSAYKDKVELLRRRVEANKRRLSEKLHSPSMEVELEETSLPLLEIAGIVTGFNEDIGAHNAAVRSRGKAKRRCKTQMGGHIAAVARDLAAAYRAEDGRLEGELAACGAELQELDVQMAAVRREIAQLAGRTRDTGAAVESINAVLEAAGFSGFSLRPCAGMPGSYELVRADGSIARDLSEGEESFIAFLYFYHRAMGGDGGDPKDKVVVVDDPASGMDDRSRSVVAALVRAMVDGCLGGDATREDAAGAAGGGMADGATDDFAAGGAFVRGDGGTLRQVLVLTHDERLADRFADCAGAEDVAFFELGKKDGASHVDLCEDVDRWRAAVERDCAQAGDEALRCTEALGAVFAPCGA